MRSNSTKQYLYYLFLILLGSYLLFYTLSDEHSVFLYSVTIGIHEAGHMLFLFFGQFIHVLGGTIAQLGVPAMFGCYFFIQRNTVATSIIGLWFAYSLSDVSLYAGDAVVQQLPLLSGSHDWFYLFSRLGVLQYTDQISTFLYFLAFLIAFTSYVVLLREVGKEVSIFKV